MPTIRIDEGEPASDWWCVTFALSEGEFADDTLAAMDERARALFDGGNKASLSLIYRRSEHPEPAVAGLIVLKRLHPAARFITFSSETKQLFGSDVELL